jgi:transcriptional regulator with XRE-family HTH domain/tetratricopeptide (TPR) repeat protein
MTARRRHLAERRRALGFSQETLAHHLGVDRTTVGRWERGETEPTPYLQPRLGKLLNTTPDALPALLAVERAAGALPAAPRPPGSSQTSNGEEHDDMYRRELLGLLTTGAVTIALPAAIRPAEPRRTSDEVPFDVAGPEQHSASLWRVFRLADTKSQVLPLVRDHLAGLTSQLRLAGSPRTREQLCALACDQYQLAGEICFDSNRYTDAANCYTLAAYAGREARAYDRWACALARQAYISLYDGRPAEASAILESAAVVARRGDHQLATRQWIASVQAQASAGCRDLGSCEGFLDLARTVDGLPAEAGPGGWLRFDGSRLAEEQGTCYLALGRAGRAHAPLTQALQQTVSLRRRGSLLADLAAAGLHRNDLDQVFQYGHQAVEIAAQTRSSGYVGRKLRTLDQQLQLFRTSQQIAQLSEQIHALTTAA